jgi:peptide/nickel transport system substrate-binding protein
MMFFKRFIFYCLLLTAYCLLLLSCQPDKPLNKKSFGDTIIAGDFRKLSSINPVLSVSSVSSELDSIIFDGLIKIDEKGEPQPNLAASWEIRDGGLKWIFYLRKNIRFHDGVEFNVEDVVFTYEAIKRPENKGHYLNVFEFVREIKAVDKYTVEITLEKPYASFLYGLDVGILPKHLLEGRDLHNAEFNYHPIGTGPYKFEKWKEDEIILKANENYFDGRPNLDKIVIKVFPNQKVMWARLMRGEIDFSSGINPSDYEIIKGIPSFKTYSVLKPYYYMIAFNLYPSPQSPPTRGGVKKSKPSPLVGEGRSLPPKHLSGGEGFKDKRVRQALNYAIDKEKIIREVLKGMGKVSAGTVYPLSYAYYQDIKPYPYNPHKALNLLKDAGWDDRDNNHILDKDGEELRFTVLINKGDEIKEKSIRLIQEQLLDIGIKLQVELIELSSLIKGLLKKNFESTFAEINSKGDPNKNYAFWHSSQINEGLNVFSYKNQRVDELLEKGRTTVDKEKRKEYYIEFQKEILDDPPGIFLFWTEYLVGVHERFEGVKVDWRGTFANIAEWYVPEEKQRYINKKKGEG